MPFFCVRVTLGRHILTHFGFLFGILAGKGEPNIVLGARKRVKNRAKAKGSLLPGSTEDVPHAEKMTDCLSRGACPPTHTITDRFSACGTSSVEPGSSEPLALALFLTLFLAPRTMFGSPLPAKIPNKKPKCVKICLPKVTRTQKKGKMCQNAPTTFTKTP